MRLEERKPENMYPDGRQSPEEIKPETGKPPVAGEMPFDGKPPVDGEMPFDGEPPFDGKPPVDGEMPFDGKPPVDGEMPFDGEPPFDEEPDFDEDLPNIEDGPSGRGLGPPGMPGGPGGPPPRTGVPQEKAKDAKGTLRRLLAYFNKERFFVTLTFLIVIVTVLCSIFAPRFQSDAIDTLVDGTFDALPPLLGKMIILYVISAIGTFLQGICSAKLSNNIIKRVREDLFCKIVRLPTRYLDRHSHGDIMSRMTNDAENVSTVISQSLSSLFSGILTLIGTLVMMLSYSPALTGLTAIVVVVSVIVTRVISKWVRKFFLERQILLGKLNGTTEERITNSRTVTAYNLQAESVAEFNATSDQLTRTAIKSEIIGSLMGPIMSMLSNISFVIVAVFGAWFVLHGSITVGVISAFIVYSKQFSRPINDLAQLYAEIQTALAGAERIFGILDEEEEDMSGQTESPVTKGTIEFRDVNFSYEPGSPVIRDFNLKIDAGKKIALVGSTGCGKTTIVNLLMRYYDPDSGSILIDGVPTTEISRETLRADIGIVLQDAVLFTDTLRANLKYADPDTSDEEMEKAARLSGSDRIAAALPEGYDTELTLAGGNLSAGQRQLVTIGRAFLSLPKILILDEATSSVDTRTEKNIQDAMVRLMKDHTSVVVAHRLSTIMDADQIVVMDQGRIVEAGTHEELLARGGKYYELYQTQFAGFAT